MLTREREIGRSLLQAPPEDRALLDLSVRRKVKDDVVAAVLRLQPEDVAPRREAALDRVAADLGIHDEAERARLPQVLADLPGDQWPDENGSLLGPPPPPPPPAAPVAAPAPPAGPSKPKPSKPKPSKPKPDRGRRRPVAALIVVLIGALLGAFIGLVLFGGDAEDDGGSSAPAPAAQAPAQKSAQLESLVEGFSGTGTARIDGSGDDSRLVMSLRDLPPREEAYAVWLYNSLPDAVLIDRVVGSSLDIDEQLPEDPSGYKFIDVSREPIDDNPNHSGASVMRLSVDELLAKQP